MSLPFRLFVKLVMLIAGELAFAKITELVPLKVASVMLVVPVPLKRVEPVAVEVSVPKLRIPAVPLKVKVVELLRVAVVTLIVPLFVIVLLPVELSTVSKVIGLYVPPTLKVKVLPFKLTARFVKLTVGVPVGANDTVLVPLKVALVILNVAVPPNSVAPVAVEFKVVIVAEPVPSNNSVVALLNVAVVMVSTSSLVIVFVPDELSTVRLLIGP